MPFTITATNSAGAVSFQKDKASSALDKSLELERSGFQKIVVKDDLGRTLSRDELALLSLGST